MNTQEASEDELKVLAERLADQMQPDGTIKTVDLQELWDELAPEEWKHLPKVGYVEGIKYFAWQCESHTPKKEEVSNLFKAVQDFGKPVGFLTTLCSFLIPTFPPDEDPTVKDFLEGNFDTSAVIPRCIILIYPAFEVTQ